MIRFSRYLEESRKVRKYVAVQYDEETQKKLRAWAKENGFDLTKSFSGSDQKEEDFDFHTTIFFTTSVHDMKNETLDQPTKTSRAVGMKYLGPDKDVPVISVDGDDIRGLRKHYESMGMEDEWPSYQPHISVSYARDNLPDIDKVKLPDFDLKYDKIEIKDASV